ncbi:HD domain protein, partial [Streptococcus agalactiae CJB111]
MVKREDVILNATENMVHHKLKNDPSGHDWFHIVRVRNLAVELAHKEGANTFICQMAALLHDIIDDKICQDSKQASYELTQWLYSQDLAIAEVEHILDILENISFKAGTGLTMKTLEGQIV